MSQQNENVNNLIHKDIISQGYMLINIEGKSGNDRENMLAFTIGMYANFGQPDILLMGENPKSIIEMLEGVVNNYRIGLTIEESVDIAELDGERLKTARLPDEVGEMLAPQIKDYYDEYHPELESVPISWVGKTSKAYPFDYFLLPENERPKDMPMFVNTGVN